MLCYAFILWQSGAVHGAVHANFPYIACYISLIDLPQIVFFHLIPVVVFGGLSSHLQGVIQ